MNCASGMDSFSKGIDKNVSTNKILMCLKSLNLSAKRLNMHIENEIIFLKEVLVRVVNCFHGI